MPQRKERPGLRALLPLPVAVLALGVAASASVYLWLRSPAALVRDFRADAAVLAYQIVSRVKRDVDEKSAANSVEWAAGTPTLDAWAGFTDSTKRTGLGGAIGWSLRVRAGDAARFYELAREAYPNAEEEIKIKRGSGRGDTDGDSVGIEDDSGSDATDESDMWPILYISPADMAMIGVDMASLPARARAIALMLETNDTSLTEVVIVIGAGLPGFVVFHPVFAHGGDSSSGIVGCSMKSTLIQSLVVDTVEAMEFSRRHPGADVAVFLRVSAGDGEDSDRGVRDQLQFDLKTYPTYTAEEYRSGRVTPLEVERRGSESFTEVAALTSRKAIVVVCSFNPAAKADEMVVVLVFGCVLSLLAALVVYDRQVLVLRYRDGMEKARVHSILKTRFVAEMSHEIRTPLTGIVGTAELLAEQNMSREANALVGTVQACSRILMGLVNDALDFSKIEAGELHVEARPVSLRQVFPEVLNVMRTTYRSPRGETVGGVILRLEVAESVADAQVLADEARIRQVLVNLLSNAFKFTDSGSITVTVRFSPVTDPLGAEEIRDPPGSPPPAPAGNPCLRRFAATAGSPCASPAVGAAAASEAAGGSHVGLVNRRSKVAPFMYTKVGTGEHDGSATSNGGSGDSGEGSGIAEFWKKTITAVTAVFCGRETPSGESGQHENAASVPRPGFLSGWWCLWETERRKSGAGGAGEGRGGGDGVNTAAFVRDLDNPAYEKAMLVVEVDDTGVGMTPQQMDRLFRPFSQVHHGSGRSVGGTGLGLVICKSLCEAMGGTVGCTSNPGRPGSTFRFSVLVGVPKTATPGRLERVKLGMHSPRSPCHLSRAGSNGATASTAAGPSIASRVTRIADEVPVGARNEAPGSERSPPLPPSPSPPPCVIREWNLSVEGSRFSVTTAALEQRRHRRAKRGKSSDAWFSSRLEAETLAGTGAVFCKGWGSTDNDTVAIGTSSPKGRVQPHLTEARLAEGTETPARRRSSQVSVEPERPRLLVVDDFRMNRVLVEKMLQALDVDVELAEDGAKAVKACRGSRFSVILMDVMMPAMSGIEAARAIRSGEGGDLNTATPIVALTASPTLREVEGVDEDEEDVMTDLLVKPMTRRSLFAMVAKWATDAEVAWMVSAWLQYTIAREDSEVDQDLNGDDYARSRSGAA